MHFTFVVQLPHAVCTQEFNPAALEHLMASTAQRRSKHLDMQFMRRRRQKNMTGATRQWFVNASLWLAGTAAAAVDEAGLAMDAQVCTQTHIEHSFHIIAHYVNHRRFESNTCCAHVMLWCDGCGHVCMTNAACNMYAFTLIQS